MDKLSGTVVFIDKSNISSVELIQGKITTEKVIITRENFGSENDSDVFTSELTKQGIQIIVAVSVNQTFEEVAKEKGITIITIDKRNIEDMFHTFSDKDTEVTIIFNDDSTIKVKLISGSLSKSYLTK